MIQMRVLLDENHAVAAGQGLCETSRDLPAAEGTADDDDVLGVGDGFVGVEVDGGGYAVFEEGEEVGW